MLTVLLIGLIGGLITGISPCILPVLPVIFFAGGRTTTTPPPGAAQVVPERVAVTAGGGGDEVVVAEPGPAPKPKRERNLRPYAVIAGLVVSFSFFTLLGSLIIGALGLPPNILRIIGTVLLVAIGVMPA